MYFLVLPFKNFCRPCWVAPGLPCRLWYSPTSKLALAYLFIFTFGKSCSALVLLYLFFWQYFRLSIGNLLLLPKRPILSVNQLTYEPHIMKWYVNFPTKIIINDTITTTFHFLFSWLFGFTNFSQSWKVNWEKYRSFPLNYVPAKLSFITLFPILIFLVSDVTQTFRQFWHLHEWITGERWMSLLNPNYSTSESWMIHYE